jgi:hypothetical protein
MQETPGAQPALKTTRLQPALKVRVQKHQRFGKEQSELYADCLNRVMGVKK